MPTQAEYYSSTSSSPSRDLFAKAEAALARNDLRQASEKGWGGGAEMVKSVAEARGAPHEGHREPWRIANRLVAETGDREIRTVFGLAGCLHTNFYEGWLPRETVEDHLSQVAELRRKLENLPV